MLPAGTPMSSAATPAFQAMPTTFALAARTYGSMRCHVHARARRAPPTACTEKSSSSSEPERSSPSSVVKYSPGTAMSSTAAKLTFAEPNHRSSNTTTQTTGVALTACSGGASRMRAIGRRCASAAAGRANA